MVLVSTNKIVNISAEQNRTVCYKLINILKTVLIDYFEFIHWKWGAAVHLRRWATIDLIEKILRRRLNRWNHEHVFSVRTRPTRNVTVECGCKSVTTLHIASEPVNTAQSVVHLALVSFPFRLLLPRAPAFESIIYWRIV